MNTIKKRLALFPDVRETLCEHAHWHYTGTIPCTGRYVCTLCGYTKAEIAQIEAEVPA